MNVSASFEQQDFAANQKRQKRLQKLEDRLTAGGSAENPVASVTVGFEQPDEIIPHRPRIDSEELPGTPDLVTKTIPSPCPSYNNDLSNSDGRSLQSKIPDSPAGEKAKTYKNNIVQDLAYDSRNSMDKVISRKRKLAPSSSLASTTPERRFPKQVTFSREDDKRISESFYNRKNESFHDIAVQLDVPEAEVRQRCQELVDRESRSASIDSQSNCHNDLTARANPVFRGGHSQDSPLATSDRADSNGNGLDLQKTSNSSGKNNSRPVDESLSSSSQRVDALRRKDRSHSPIAGGSISRRNALKNQQSIVNFFGPVGSSANEKRKKTSDDSFLSSEQDGIAHLPETRCQSVSTPCNRSPSVTASSRGLSNKEASASKDGSCQFIVNEAVNNVAETGSVAVRSVEWNEMDSALREKSKMIEKLQLQSKEQDEAHRAELQRSLEVHKKEISELQQRNTFMRDKTAEVLEKLIRELDSEARQNQRRKLIDDSYRLGQITLRKYGFGPRFQAGEDWEIGNEFKELYASKKRLSKRKENLEKQRKNVLKALKQRRSTVAGLSSAEQTLNMLEEAETTEAFAAEMASLRRMEQEQNDQESRLEREKILHIRSLKRIREEDQSRFNRQPVLNNRYLLRGLIGKGGFSEVWRGFDLIELRDVAVKVHQLAQSWSEQRKESYIKHAKRECQIHCSLSHRRIIRLFEVFSIDNSSFATVLEYCPGTDLEMHLKRWKTLPEREAHAIILQVLSGLLYLNTGVDIKAADESGQTPGAGADEDQPSTRLDTHPRIIHYDLKPGNILMDGQGGIKITDFGLSKIMEMKVLGENDGIELTSQGAGTYWYLPPECFRMDEVVHISSKVDVWSVGVILYQMLYGVRPFGEGLTQDKMMQNHTMLKATTVEFNPKPVVSEEAKVFIRRCLTHDQKLRPDVETLCQDEYISMKFSNRK